jgi:hypothetical protein
VPAEDLHRTAPPVSARPHDSHANAPVCHFLSSLPGGIQRIYKFRV